MRNQNPDRHPYFLELLKTLLSFCSHNNMTHEGLRSFNYKSILDIDVENKLSEETIRRIFVKGQSANYNCDISTLDLLIKYLDDKKFTYTNWNDFVNQEKPSCPANIPEKHFFRLPDGTKNIVSRAVNDRMKKLVALPQKNTPPLSHLYTLTDLQKETADLKFLIDNNLLFFTDVELENHRQLIQVLKMEGTALFIGNPATGKTTAMIDLMTQLEKQQFRAYYHSFKKRDRWGDVWDEILKNASIDDTIFILDDIHLGMDAANEAFVKAQSHPTLRLLFVSREVESHNETELTELYDALSTRTVRTEIPSLDAKVEGIARAFRIHFLQQKTLSKEEIYELGDMELIVQKIHRNLVVLREYLRIWEDLPDTPLSKLEETQIYKKMYQHYFPDQGIKESWEKCLLQYLTLYYFEIPFRANPRYLAQTEALAENANRIVAEKDRLYSLYHGEYAHLLLKAYSAHNTARFKQAYPTWEDFFATQLKAYFLDFQAEEGYLPDALALLHSIRVSQKEASDLILQKKEIFRILFNADALKNFLLELCKEEKDDRLIVSFLSSLLSHSPQNFYIFFRIFRENGQFLKSRYSFLIYCKAFMQLKRLNFKHDLEKIEKEIDVLTLAELANFQAFNDSLNLLNQNYPSKVHNILKAIRSEVIVEKAQIANFGDISRCLNELKKINIRKSEEVLELLSTEDLVRKAQVANLGEISLGLVELKKINVEKAKKIFEHLPVKAIVEKAQVANLAELGHALIELKNINEEKAKDILTNLSTQTIVEKAKYSSLADIGHALNELRSINAEKSKEIYEKIDIEILLFKSEQANLRIISNVMIELKKVDEARTCELIRLLIKQQNFIELITKQVQEWETTEKIDLTLWNHLAVILTSVEKENSFLFNLLMDFGLKNMGQITVPPYIISTMGTFIRFLSEWTDMSIFVKEHILLFRRLVLITREKKYIARFITIIYNISPQEAINYLFEPYQIQFPKDFETIGFTYFYLGKNNFEKQSFSQAIFYLERAKIYIQRIEGHENTLYQIEELLITLAK